MNNEFYMDQGIDADYVSFRSFSYDLFRRLLIEEPTPELLHFLQQQDLPALFSLLPQQDSFTSALNSIERYLVTHRFIAGDDTFEDLHWDFTRLFIGPDKPLAPPWESVYHSQDGALFQQITQDVQQIYTEQGFVLSCDELEAADHIGFELDFLYQQSILSVELCEQTSHPEQFLALLQQQYAFLTHHVCLFSNIFCQCIQQSANTPFYRDFSIVLQQFLHHDKQQLQTMIELMME